MTHAIDAFDRLTKEQVTDLIIWQMFRKSISLEELTKRIKGREAEVIAHVNEYLRR